MEPSTFVEFRSLFCGRCGMARVFQRRKVRRRLHFLISLGTLGLWLPAWGAIILIQRIRPWACVECGARQWGNARTRKAAVAHD